MRGRGAEASGVGVGREGAERGELAQAMQARDEQSSVNRAGNIGRDVDRCDHGDVEHVGHVAGGEAALAFGDEDDPVRSLVSGRQEAREGDVARAAEDDVVLVGSRRCCDAVSVWRVDHDGLRRRLVECGRGRYQCEVRGDFDGFVGDGHRDADERGGRGHVGDEFGRAMTRGVERERGGDGRGALSAACAGQQDRAGRHRAPSSAGCEADAGGTAVDFPKRSTVPIPASP